MQFLGKFLKIKINNIPREQNAKASALVLLALDNDELDSFAMEMISKPSIGKFEVCIATNKKD